MIEINGVKRRNTKQKSIILDYLKSNKDKHLTAEEIVDNLKSSNLKVGKATVYRLLNNLTEEGTLRKYVLSDNLCSCYQYVGDIEECNRHYHLVCDDCGKVSHCDNANMNKLAQSISQKDSFDLNLQKIILYGKCNKCTSIRSKK